MRHAAWLGVVVAGSLTEACTTPHDASSPVPVPSAEASAEPVVAAAPVTPPEGPDAAAPSEANVKTLFVDEALADCMGESPMKCLRVRESESADWTLHYGDIEGFTHEAGYRYELRVKVTEVPNPPADGSSLRHELVEVVSKKHGAAKGGP